MKIILICIILINFNYIKCSEPLGIIHGNNVPVNEARYFVGITDANGFSYCGGTLFKSNKVLTAAHCFNHEKIYPVTTVFIKYGTKSREMNKKNLILASRIDINEEYDNTIEPVYKRKGDIAVVTLSESINSSLVVYATLQDRRLKPRQNFTLYGLGLKNYTHKLLPSQLKKATLTFFSRYDDKLLCESKDQSGCDGDSGGPAVSSDGKISGVYSQTIINCTYGRGNPDMVTEVYPYLNWIQAQ